MARNRAMAMHTHLTANYVVPRVTAQTESQGEDRDMIGIGRDRLEWMTMNSDYGPSFLLGTMGRLVHPGEDFRTGCHALQTLETIGDT